MVRVSILCGLVVAACSSSSPSVGSATVAGSIGGSPFAVGDAIALVDQAHKTAKIVVTSTPNACADIGNHIARQNSRVLVMMVYDDAGASLETGTYPTSYTTPTPSRWSVFESNAADAACNVSYVPPPDGTGDGSLTLTSVSGTTLAGSFDVILEDSSHVTGTFDPVACPALANEGGSPTCMP